MKICDVVQFYSPIGGGIRRYILDKAHHFSQRGGIEHIVIIPSDRYEIVQQENSRFYKVKSIKIPGSLSYRALLNREEILKIIQKEKPDILEVGDPYRPAWICLEASRRWNIPVMAFYHSDFPRALGRTIHKFLGQRIENWLAPPIESYIVDVYNRMQATVVASHRLKQVLTDIGLKNVVRIPLGTDIEVFRPLDGKVELHKHLNIDQNCRLLLFVGRLAREKNIRSLVGMMDVLQTQNNHCYHLLFVGDGEQRRRLERMISNRSDVSWYQFSNSTTELAKYYSAADLFVHAGCYETFGITSLEAQACGTPVLAVEGGGLDDTVAGENPLIMAQSSHPNDLAEAAIRLLDSRPQQRSDIRRQRIVSHFSIQTTFERMVSLYSHVSQNRPAEEFQIDETTKPPNRLYDPAVLSN